MFECLKIALFWILTRLFCLIIFKKTVYFYDNSSCKYMSKRQKKKTPTFRTNNSFCADSKRKQKKFKKPAKTLNNLCCVYLIAFLFLKTVLFDYIHGISSGLTWPYAYKTRTKVRNFRVRYLRRPKICGITFFEFPLFSTVVWLVVHGVVYPRPGVPGGAFGRLEEPVGGLRRDTSPAKLAPVPPLPPFPPLLRRAASAQTVGGRLDPLGVNI